MERLVRENDEMGKINEGVKAKLTEGKVEIKRI